MSLILRTVLDADRCPESLRKELTLEDCLILYSLFGDK